MSRSQRARRRNKLWERDPHCRFCGVETVLPENVPEGPIPDNMATIEHLDSRNNPDRGKFCGQERTTLACFKCNNDRNKEEVKKIPIEKRREISKRGHRPPMQQMRMVI